MIIFERRWTDLHPVSIDRLAEMHDIRIFCIFFRTDFISQFTVEEIRYLQVQHFLYQGRIRERRINERTRAREFSEVYVPGAPTKKQRKIKSEKPQVEEKPFQTKCTNESDAGEA